jgi:phage baseplate assembly protein gpV
LTVEKALAVVRDHLGDDVSYWLKWIEYLAGSVRHGGFEVH